MLTIPQARFYDWFIEPLLRKGHGIVAGIPEANSRVLDLACGNGSLAFIMAERVKQVTGIDISEENISYAVSKKGKKGIHNTEFICMDAKELDQFDGQRFDYATVSMALHQFSPDSAVRILKELKHYTSCIIIMDYTYPLAAGLPGLLTRAIERMAGKDHHQNFKKYLHMGGSWRLAELCGLKVSTAAAHSVFSILRCEVPGKEKSNSQGVLFSSV